MTVHSTCTDAYLSTEAPERIPRCRDADTSFPTSAGRAAGSSALSAFFRTFGLGGSLASSLPSAPAGPFFQSRGGMR